MAAVPRVLLDHVADDPSQARPSAVWPKGDFGRLIQTAIGQCLTDPRARAGDDVEPVRKKLLRSLFRVGPPIPVRVGGPIHRVPWRRGLISVQHWENQESSTPVKCLSIPARVMDVGPTVAVIPAISSPLHFHASVARWKSRKPRRVSTSLPARGGSGLPCSSSSATSGQPSRGPSPATRRRVETGRSQPASGGQLLRLRVTGSTGGRCRVK
jgi:hypothetical protein